MRAYVKTTKGNFPNQNFYMAWHGFTHIGFDVIKFEEEELDNPDFWKECTKETPVFAGVTVFDKVISKLGVDYRKIDTYPTVLWPYMHRSVEKSILAQVEIAWNIQPFKKFMKPVNQKVFNGAVMNTMLDWIPLVNIPKNTEVYLTDPIDFVSEYRCYIQDQEIVQGKHYAGDWNKAIDLDVVEQAIRDFKSEAPVAYALDFGLTGDGKTALVEFNDFTSLGNYGLDTIHYAEMIMARWHEICK
jgi:hypothetical protein